MPALATVGGTCSISGVPRGQHGTVSRERVHAEVLDTFHYLDEVRNPRAEREFLAEERALDLEQDDTLGRVISWAVVEDELPGVEVLHKGELFDAERRGADVVGVVCIPFRRCFVYTPCNVTQPHGDIAYDRFMGCSACRAGHGLR